MMPKKNEHGQIFVVLYPDKEISLHSSCQDAAGCANITRNTLHNHIQEHGKYDKNGFLIVKREIKRIKGRGKHSAF
jgi:hypothetical protein